MKFLFSALSAFALILAQNASGQVGNPAVSSGLRFEEYPVDLSTGLPKVTLPLYSMPTRSKDISVDMSLNYHQSSVGFFGRRSGNCGRGWNLSAGGAVQKKEPGTNVYNFNFMGFSGKLIAYPVYTTPGTGYANITENSGRKLEVSIETSISTVLEDIKITAFVFTDDKGNTYRFETFDIINIETYPNDVRNITPTRWSFQLTDIYDTNSSENNGKGRQLAHFDYVPYNEQVKFGQFADEVTKNNTLMILDKVTVDGYGSAMLGHNSLPDQTLSRPGENGIWVYYGGLTIRDFLNNKVKSFSFNTYGDYDADGKLNLLLTSVEEYGTDSLDPQVYRLFYRNMTAPVAGAYVVGVDAYGYRNLYDKWCAGSTEIVQKVDKDKVVEGVLEKITFPTGGCAIYEYESGTIGVSSADPEYYYDLYNSSMWHNYTITEIGTLSTDFTVPPNTEAYFKFHGVEGPNGLGGFDFPSFTLTASGSPTSLKSFTAQNGYNNSDNNCLGYKRVLSGTYRISKGAFGLSASASVYTMTRVPVPKKWTYGGGIRVKTIAYFDVDAPKEYFYPSQTTSTVTPSKIQYYKYNIFGDLNSSSGQGTLQGDSAPVIYSNVTVSDVLGDNKSRTEFSFYSPADFVGSVNYESDFRSGKIKSKKIYNNQNVLQLETAYEYDSIVSNNSGAGVDLYKMGWMMLKQSLTKEYLGTTLQTKENFDYDSNRNISRSTVATSRSSESLITNYYYHLFNEIYPYIKNRVSELERVEKFVNTTPVSKTKIEYSYSWLNSGGVKVNGSYLPNKTSFAKGSGVLEVRTTNNLYDQYGNVLESEKTGGIKTSSIWGYNGTLLIVSIENVPYNSIPAALITAAQAASDSGNEANLLTALTALRNTPVLANALVTTYTYKPLIGVSSVTDTRGYKMTFEYDSKGREKKVKDQDGNIITEKFYNTKPQN